MAKRVGLTEQRFGGYSVTHRWHWLHFLSQNRQKVWSCVEIRLPHLHTFSQAQGHLFPYSAFSLATLWCTTKLLHWLWSKKGIYLKSVCEGVIIHHHSTNCWDLPTSRLDTSTLLYFSSQIFSGGGHWGCSQWCSWDLHQLPLDCHPLHGEQAVLLRPG